MNCVIEMVGIYWSTDVTIHILNKQTNKQTRPTHIIRYIYEPIPPADGECIPRELTYQHNKSPSPIAIGTSP